MPTLTASPSKVPSGFERQEVTVNGARVVLHVGGAGEPLLFLHGAGTVSGFHFAASWARKFKVYLPYHPGYGESPDSDALTSIDDYVLHYLDLMEHLNLDNVRLVGLSVGGWIAATLATRDSRRLKKLVLIGPAGLRVPAHPTTDIFRVRPEDVPAYFVQDLGVLAPHVPDPHGPDFLDFLVNDYHEMSSYARLAWERPYDPKLARWLHRVDVPTLVLYGDQDRVTPVEQSRTWAALIPNARVQIVKGAGHLVLDEAAEAPELVLDFLA